MSVHLRALLAKCVQVWQSALELTRLPLADYILPIQTAGNRLVVVVRYCN
jgi:hypothetical protein